MRRTCGTVLFTLALATGRAAASDDFDFDAFSLEELTSLEITTAVKRPQRVIDTAAAVYVITAEDLRRSGHTSVPEALRLVPGMQVDRPTGSEWAISARGFEDLFANKLLVLIDGRSVYTSLFFGVFWDMQTPPMADIERIEVIRGPGATLWGANAVNGVINIITTPARGDRGVNIVLASVPVPFPPFNVPIAVSGSPDADSEVLLAYEVGYRAEINPQLSFDIALFAHDYENLLELQPTLRLENRGEDRSQGAEIAFNWLPLSRMKVWGSWSTIHIHTSERTPHHGWQVHTAFRPFARSGAGSGRLLSGSQAYRKCGRQSHTPEGKPHTHGRETRLDAGPSSAARARGPGSVRSTPPRRPLRWQSRDRGGDRAKCLPGSELLVLGWDGLR